MNIEELLSEKGLTKSAFAELVGVKKQNINSLLTNPTLETLERFARALDVEVWQLFTSKEQILEQDKNTIVCPRCGARFKCEE